MYHQDPQVREVHPGCQVYLPEVHPDSRACLLQEVIVQAAEVQMLQVAEAVNQSHRPVEDLGAGSKKLRKKPIQKWIGFSVSLIPSPREKLQSI